MRPVCVLLLCLALIMSLEASAIAGDSSQSCPLDKDLAAKVASYEKQVQDLQKVIEQKDEQIHHLETEVKKLLDKPEVNEVKIEAKSCLDFGNSTDVHNITLSTGNTFEVLCNADIEGPGWTVIQQRVRGGVDFERDWVTYQAGFGDFWDGDFFLGLDKIHKLTNEQPHELYIHIEKFNGSIYFARYDEFVISGEEDDYTLSKLDGFSGNATDHTSKSLDCKFSTYDHDNDVIDVTNCAAEYGPWWYNDCQAVNLNGKYYDHEVDIWRSVNWDSLFSLKVAKMLIRPKSESN